MTTPMQPRRFVSHPRRTACWLLMLTLSMAFAPLALAQSQSKAQQRCLDGLFKGAFKVGSTQGKENARCVKNAGANKLVGQTADECLTADSRGKVQKAFGKTLDLEAKRCAQQELPSFGYTSGADVNAAMYVHEVELTADVFGSPVYVGILHDRDGSRCQAAMARAYEKVAATRSKEFARCLKRGLKDGSIVDEDTLAACAVADPRGKVAAAKTKAVAAAAKRCAGIAASAAFKGKCAASTGTAELGDCTAAAAECRTCVALSAAGGFVAACDMLDNGSLDGSCVQCGNGVLDPGEECDDGEANSDTAADACRTTCEVARCGDFAVDTGETCDDGGNSAACDLDCTPAQCGDGFANAAAGEDCDTSGPTAACDADCTSVVCGDGDVNPAAGEGCDDGGNAGGDGCSAACDCEPGFSAPACQALECPGSSVVVVHAGTTGTFCLTDGDCAVGSCDTGLNRCVTATSLDSGWSGIAHDSDVTDGIVTSAYLHCPGPYQPSSSEPCGQCYVTGLDASSRSCRCANDNRQVCDEPFASDLDDCGGAACNCYLGPPLPLSSGNTPACVVNRFSENISGTVNVDTGAGAARVRLKAVVYLGENIVEPCPYCSGDPVANDGVRGGTCVDGANAGAACDVDAVSHTFPAPGGDGHSIDCFPSQGKNVSGQGLTINLDPTTGSVSLPATVPCGFSGAPEICPCGICDKNSSLSCNLDTDCGVEGPCRAVGNGNPRQNGCSDKVCSNAGGGEGVCLNGPENRFCDGVTRASGEGFVQCNSNADCAASSCGTTSCGLCTLSKLNECFLDPIEASGSVDPVTPVTAAVFCIPPTANGAINTVAGLPGPGRTTNQNTSVAFCESAPAVAYSPGVGGCPATTTSTTTLPTLTTTTTTTTLISTTPCGDAFPVCTLGGGCPPGQSCQLSGLACACAP